MNWKGLLSISMCIVLVLSSCRKDDDGDTAAKKYASDYSAEVAVQWSEMAMRLVKETPGFTPPVAARAYGYLGVTLYESLLPGMPQNRTLAGQINGLLPGMFSNTKDVSENLHWGVVANHALSTYLKATFDNASAANVQRVDSLVQYWDNQFFPETSQALFNESVSFGNKVGAEGVLYCASDGQSQCHKNNFPTDFTIPTGPGLWEPTPPVFSRPLQPYWGSVRPFLSTDVVGTVPVQNVIFSTDKNSQFFKDALQVYSTVQAIRNLDPFVPEQKVIAEFWSDDPGKTATPPGHSLSILGQILRQEESDLAFSAEAYARLAMALHDAFVACWYTKYQVNLMRPVTYIQKYIDPTWTSLLATPPFPEYTSGHSVQSGAMSSILSAYFGQNYQFTDRTHEKRTDINGSPRTYASFDAAAREAAISRLYGGIHYIEAINDGVETGKQIGQNILNLKLKK